MIDQLRAFGKLGEHIRTGLIHLIPFNTVINTLNNENAIFIKNYNAKYMFLNLKNQKELLIIDNLDSLDFCFQGYKRVPTPDEVKGYNK